MFNKLKTQNHVSDEWSDLFNRAFCLISDSFSEKITARVSGIMPNFEIQNKKIGYELDAIKNQIESLNNISDLIDNVNHNNRILASQFYEARIIEPMIRNLFPMIDLIDGARKKIESTSTALKPFVALQTHLEQFIATYGIESIRHKVQDEFDPKMMKPLCTVITDNLDLNGFVAESLQCGFKTETRILRLETVSIYKHQQSQIKTTNMERI